MDKFKNFPPELIRIIFEKHTKITPSLLQNFSKFMDKKTKRNLISCAELINENNLYELKKLKFYKKKACTHRDLLMAAKKNHDKIVKYLLFRENFHLKKRNLAPSKMPQNRINPVNGPHYQYCQ